jgi:drug/metabolite transporter superfamily protein YnfA
MSHASHSAHYRTGSGGYGNRAAGRLLAALTALFALRVAAQAIQFCAPLSFLPPFAAFQGSDLPYGVLLSSQLAILMVMIGVTSRVRWGALRRSARAARVLAAVGGVYLAGSLARLVVGVTVPDAGPWMSASIPAFFHIVLAAFVLGLAAYHAGGRGRPVEVSS